MQDNDETVCKITMKIMHDKDTAPSSTEDAKRPESQSTSNTVDLLDQLNDEQARAVTHTGSPLLIVAGAGTGKTTVLTRRVAWLMREQRVPAEHILALTFTEKAAEEMEERVDRLVPMGQTDVTINTFHGFCDSILRQYGLEIGLDTNYDILSAPQQWLFLRKHLFDLPLQLYRPLGRPTAFLASLAQHISRAKDEDITPDAYLAYAKQQLQKAQDAVKNAPLDEDAKAQVDEAQRITELAQTYAAVQERMLADGVLDFGDLISYTLQLLRQRPSVRKRIQDQYQYILVDEFQDTNIAQMELVKLIAEPHNHITVVGDDAQAIYKFRGASVSNILQFRNTYPDATQIVLTENYRSTQEILDTAYASIQFNNPDTLEVQEGITKKLTAARGSGEVPCHVAASTAEREALNVVNLAIQYYNQDQGAKWSDTAVLVRSNAHADIFATYFSAKNIPFTFKAAKGLYAKSTIRDVLSYLRVLYQPLNSVALHRVLTLPILKIPLHDVATLSAHAQKHSQPLYHVLLPEHRQHVSGLSQQGQERIDTLITMIHTHRERMREEDVGAMILAFLEETGLLKQWKSSDEAQHVEALGHISLLFQELQAQAAVLHKQQEGSDGLSHTLTVREFVEELDVRIEAGEDPSPVAFEDGPDAVQIMTVHGSKGLEFKNVFVVHLVSDRFPVRKRSEPLPLPDDLIKEELPTNDPHLLEERRLFYVAMTRAQKRLIFTSAKDYGGKRKKKPSRFLLELRSTLEQLELQAAREKGQTSLFIADDDASITTIGGTSIGSDVVAPAQPKKPSYKIPSALSFSQLKAFETCPRQYEFSHLLKIPGRGSHVFSYGKSLHHTLQKFYEELQQGVQPQRERLQELLNQCWVNEYYQSAKHMKARKQEAKETLHAYFDRHQGQFPVPLSIEKGFRLKLGKYTFKGFIDRVDPLQDRTVAITDYKTGKPPKSQKDVDQNMQLSLYALAVRDAWGLTPGPLRLEYLDDGSVWTTERSNEELDLLKDELLDRADDIHASDFEPTPGFHCQFCDFKYVCDAAQI